MTYNKETNMNFIQKRIQQKRLEQEQQLKSECSYSISYLDIYISTLKDDIKRLMLCKKYLTDDNAFELIWDIEQIESFYESFLHDLKQEEFTYKETYYKCIKNSAKQHADYMQQLKKQYRAEFESIYNTFKRITKGTNFPRRNEILSKMRKAFDFDSSKYYSKDDQFIIMR